MKKIGLLSLALVLALGSLGIGYAHWTDTLQIKGDINNGWVDVNFASQYDNDPGDMNDPMGPGSWQFTAIGVPVWQGDRYDKDVASTTSTFSRWDGEWPSDRGNEAEIVITNGYPSYWGSVMWDIENNGSIPVELWTMSLVAVDGPGAPWTTLGQALEIGIRYYVDADADGQIDQTLDAGDDFSFILSAHNLEQLDPYTAAWNFPKGYLDITVHVEQDSEEKAGYDFAIDYVFANWNEVPVVVGP